MRFGVREICEVVLRAKATQYLGNKKYYKNEPVLYFDSLKTSSLEGAATTVYATGGRGNTRLVAWEGERTLTFTMEDALISPESFSILSGAGLVDASEDKPLFVHTTSQIVLDADNTIKLPEVAAWNGYDADDDMYQSAADIFIMELKNGQIAAEPCIPANVENKEDKDGKKYSEITCYGHNGAIKKGTVVIVDYYVKRTTGAQLIEITADKFGGNYYLEASTLFRDETSGVDMPAEFIIPNCKIQSNFTFSMAATGDPSTFTFTMDAFPDYVKFDQTHKVLAAIQVITEAVSDEEDKREVCQPGEEEPAGFKQTASSDATGATVNITKDTDTVCNISVTGSSVVDNAKDDPMFNLNDELIDTPAMVMTVNMPVDEKGGTYHIKQTNPALKAYEETDNRVKKVGDNYVKNNDYTLKPGETMELSFLVTEETKTAELVLSQGGKTIKTYNITADVTFAE